jgi:methionyl-tRNA formyltransferase
VTLTRPLERDDALLDPGFAAARLERQVRAYQPWPGAAMVGAEGRVLVWRAHVEPSEAGDEAGYLVRVGRDGLALATPDGRLVLDEVQPAGGRRMTGAELLRGRPALVVR